MKRWFVIQGIFVMVMVLVLAGDRAAAGSLQVSNVFTQGSPAVAEEVNQNFTDIETSVNDNDQRISQLESALAQLAARLAVHENTAPVARTGSFTISPISGNTSESGTTATCTVRLGSQPTAAVTIPVSSSNTSEGTVAIASLTFTSANWNTNQTVTVTGLGDILADGDITYSIILGTASSADTLYNGLDPSDVTVTNIDDTVSTYSVTPAISAGNYHNLVLANDGSVWGWGSCGSGQLDVSATCTTTSVLPQQINITKAAAISAGYDFSAIVDNTGSVWTSGVDTFSDGFLGHAPATRLAKVDNLTDVKMVATGTYHALALKNDGTVWAWGNGLAGSLGNGSYIISQNPVQSTGLTEVSAIAVGADHSLALDASGTVYSWGSDGYEQLGSGVPWPVANDTATPTAISSLSGVILIGAGQYQSFAYGIKPTIHLTNKDAWGWGANANNFLGISTLAIADPGSPALGGYFSSPNALNTFSNTVFPSKIDSGFYHTVALGPNGAVYSWGDNDKDASSDESYDNRGALGNGTETDRAAGPTLAFTAALGSPGPAIDVDAGANYTLVLFADGRLQTSGKNTSAQLGSNEIASDDTTIYTTSPVYVEDPGDIGPASPSNFYAYRPILAGYPTTATTSTTATVQVCPNNLVAPANCGPITHYKHSTDNGSTWGAATAITTPISLSSLPLGPVNLWVKGMRDAATEIQSDPSAVKVSWIVN